MSNEIFDKLTAEFRKDLVSFRPGKVSRNKKLALPLAYIDARDVMDRLDQVVGFDNWQDRYEFHGPRTICYLSIKINDEWITKADGAGDTNIEGEKGGISDALKRSAVKWGIGRYLYDLKFRDAPTKTYESNGKTYVVGFAESFTRDPWSFLIRDENTFNVAFNAAKDQMVSIIKDDKVDPKIIGRFRQSYPELAMAVDMTSDIKERLNG